MKDMMYVSARSKFKFLLFFMLVPFFSQSQSAGKEVKKTLFFTLKDTIYTLPSLDYKKNDAIGTALIFATIKSNSNGKDKVHFIIDNGSLPLTVKVLNPEFQIPNNKSADTSFTDTLYIVYSGNGKSKSLSPEGKVTLNEDGGKDSIKLSYSELIAGQSLSIFGALYTAPKIFQDDNPNLTQTYLRLNIPIRKIKGVPNDADFWKRWVWLRNCFLQFTYTTNSLQAFFADSAMINPRSTGDSIRFRSVNKLDLLENADWNASATVPLFTFIFARYKNHFFGGSHLYIEPFISLSNTTLKHGDTSSLNMDTVNFSIRSLVRGFDIGLRTENTQFAGNRINFEFNFRLFWMSPLSSAVNGDLNYQFKRINDYKNIYPLRNLLYGHNQPFYNFDFLGIYNTNKNDPDNSSNVFLHFTTYGNFYRKGTAGVYNNYYLLQFGYALNILNFLNQLQPKQ